MTVFEWVVIVATVFGGLTLGIGLVVYHVDRENRRLRKSDVYDDSVPLAERLWRVP